MSNKPPSVPRPEHQTGFCLVTIIVTLVLIAIIAALALTSGTD